MPDAKDSIARTTAASATVMASSANSTSRSCPSLLEQGVDRGAMRETRRKAVVLKERGGAVGERLQRESQRDAETAPPSLQQCASSRPDTTEEQQHIAPLAMAATVKASAAKTIVLTEDEIARLWTAYEKLGGIIRRAEAELAESRQH